MKLFLVAMLLALLFITIYNFNYSPVRSHNSIAMPKEIFSLYNNTIIPTIDGKIEFNGTTASLGWGSAAVYDLYNELQESNGKVFLQNDDSYFYIGLDMIDFEEEDPSTVWGAAVYFDLNHNGVIDSNDRCVNVLTEINETLHVDIREGLSDGSWDIITTGTTGTEIPSYNITVDMDYSTSFFDQTNAHRQYEFRIDLDTLGKSPGDLFGIGFEATTQYSLGSESIVWPYLDGSLLDIRTEAHFWGDIQLGDSLLITKYIIEDNFNIKDSAIGPNNGTFFAKGDIDGDGDLELIVSSNRTVAGDNSLIAIYESNSDGITQIWNSWTSTHYSSCIVAQGIVCYDFTGDGKDEIYFVGSDNHRVYRLRNWNSNNGDFDDIDSVYSNAYDFMGYIAVGDASNDGNVDLLIGDEAGYFVVLEYNSEFTQFTRWQGSYYSLYPIDGSSVTRIHAVAIADMDYLDSSYDEILLLAQFSADDSISSTGLRILEISSTSLYDNSIFEDDLSQYSHSNTFDRFGHTILVEDVDNDAIKETVIVGRDYLKIFGFDSFSDAEIPLVLDINDETYPAMGGGAGIFDLDGDGSNELIVGCNNGTTFVFQISDLDPDPEDEDLQLVTEWKGDLGSTPGKRGSIIDFDIDNDGNVEAIIADQFGQIIVLGEGQYPEVSITSPSPGYTSGRDSILFEWEMSNDSLPIIYHDIYINSVFSMRIGGAQRGVAIPLIETDNNVTVISRDIRGMTSSDEKIVSYIPGAPSVDITSPENVHITSSASITVQYDSFDPQSDILSFEIYANGSLKGITTNNQLTFSLDSEGIWNITVIADDSYGDRVRDSINVIFDQDQLLKLLLMLTIQL
ncbi:MAG: FG-GAP-like repeat-containing protein [Candidatus Heimdallarchaeota archaeon]